MPRSGISSTVASAMLQAATGTSTVTAANAMNFAQLATGDPGSAGTANASGNTTRESVTWPGTPTSNAMAASNQPAWTNWPSANNGEIETDITLWSASSAGTFGASMQLGSSVTMDTGDSLTLTQVQLSLASAIAS